MLSIIVLLIIVLSIWLGGFVVIPIIIFNKMTTNFLKYTTEQIQLNSVHNHINTDKLKKRLAIFNLIKLNIAEDFKIINGFEHDDIVYIFFSKNINRPIYHGGYIRGCANYIAIVKKTDFLLTHNNHICCTSRSRLPFGLRMQNKRRLKKKQIEVDINTFQLIGKYNRSYKLNMIRIHTENENLSVTNNQAFGEQCEIHSLTKEFAWEVYEDQFIYIEAIQFYPTIYGFGIYNPSRLNLNSIDIVTNNANAILSQYMPDQATS